MIIKQKLAELPMCYCISLMDWEGRQYCVTASEDRGGEMLLIDTTTKATQKIVGLAGGVMSILPIPEEEGSFLAIQRFYPVFDSKEAEIVHCHLEKSDGDVLEAKVRTVAKLPYVHRIDLVGKPGSRRIIAATLCHSKAFQDDWSQPGGVYALELDGDFQMTRKWQLLDGIHKNHGMFDYRKSQGSYVLVAGEEGVWAVDGSGATQRLCGESVGDLCMWDVDGDGIDEMLCIAPFHGDHFKILKRVQDGWRVIWDSPVEFGHAVWCGALQGTPLAITCSRGGERNIRMYRPAWKGDTLEMEIVDLDVQVGASNITVDVRDDALVLYAANHGQNEVARYTITP